MDGSAAWFITSRTCDHHTRIVRFCAVMTIHAIVEKDDSFHTQGVLAHGVPYKLIQQMDAFAVSSPYRGRAATTHASRVFAYIPQM